MQPTARRTAKITADLPTAAAIEIRLLRSSPDLIGDVDHGREVDVAVISLLGYLALHDGSAPIEQLRSVFGARRRSSAFAERALIAAIDRTRRRLGVERIPHGWGTDGCRLPASVSCDWSRFSALAATANACDEAALAERGRDARAMALELVEGPPCETVRDLLPWLDDEQIIGEMVAEIVAVAHDLVLSEIAEGTVAALDRADWALRQGRRVAPDHAALVEAAMFLADARGDDAAMTDEFESALEAVDRLELGEEISPRLETVFATLRRDRPR
jgi:hypothetical protein